MPHPEPDPPVLYEQKRVVGLGELVWDYHPGGKALGGAPANFVVMAARLGDHGILASRIGVDDAGKEALAVLAEMPVDLNYLQSDVEHATGTVRVVHDGSEPQYNITQPVAWDFLDFTPQWRELAESAHAVCFGTLAQRHPRSRQSIQAFLAATQPECVRVFDANLRQSFYDAAVLRDSLGMTTLLKMNEHEVPRILALLEDTARNAHRIPENAADRLLHNFPALQLVCITLGGEGSLLVTREEQHRHYGVHSNVADTVGAGDAFTAALVHYYLDGAPLPMLNEAGNRWGAWVASQRGAIPALDAETLAGNAQAIAKVGQT